MNRQELIDLIRENIDPEPKDWPRHRGWDDGVEFIADKILRRMVPNPVMAMSECPACGLKAESLEHRFCTREPCPVNNPAGIRDGIVGHLGAALTQSIPKDDQIIMGHVKDAYALAVALPRS